ncbi:MAG: putative bifunctional diguanylate cyclase/phosphodiesterase [Pseudomonadales bacterium]
MLLDVFDKIPTPILLIDRSGKVEAFSEAFVSWSQTPLRVGANISEQLSEDLYLCLQEPLQRAANGEYAELTINLSSGSGKRARLCVNPTRHGCVILAKIPLENLFDHESADKLQDLLRVTFDTIDQGISIYDEELRLVTWNSKFESMGIHSHAPIEQGKSLIDSYREVAELGVFGPGDPEQLAQEHIDIIRTRKMKLQEDLHSPSGKVIQINRYYLSGGGMCAVFTDVTEQRESQRELVHQANHDFLTGCLNRQFIVEAIDELIVRYGAFGEREIYLFFIDLDRFKFVNDTFGHAMGDKLLRYCADRLQQFVEQGDYLARLGGDEFLIAIHRPTDCFDVGDYAARLLNKVCQPYYIAGNRIHMSSSIGIVSSPADSGNAIDLIAKADIAMYQAKLKGRSGSYFYTDELGEKIKRRTLVANQLSDDVSRKRGFYLHYQPILNLQTDRIVSFEALLRWHNDELGQVSPQEFISIAEDSGDIAQLGAFVIEEACRFLAQIGEQSQGIKVGVNVSSLQLLNPQFCERLEESIARHSVNPQHIVVEITESAIIDDLNEVYQNLVSIRALGCGLAIDDFGTGYSSLSYIRKYPFSHIKIDGCFIKDLQSNAQNLALVKSVIDIASAFELKVVAEGIETLEENSFLKQINCTFAQGYYHSRPVDEETAMTMLLP